MSTMLASCQKANFDCSFAKKPRKPGPKGPRATTSNRIKRKLHDIRSQAALNPSSTNPPAVAFFTGATDLPPDSAAEHTVPNGAQASYVVGSLPVTSGPSVVAFQDLCDYLTIYHFKMYAIWPVVDIEWLIGKLGDAVEDPELLALAHAICAGTGAQLRLDADDGGSPGPHSHTLVDHFAIDAERYRARVGVGENVTVSSILIPFFLHMYYSSKKKIFKAVLCLRESLTLAELFELDNESSYIDLDQAEQGLRRKVFWLLFVTERGHSMQHGMATVLRNKIDLPDPEDDKDPVRLVGFLSLVRLFVAVEGMLVEPGDDGSESESFNSERFRQLQLQLRQSPQISSSNNNEVQRTDLCITQHWMRMLLWQTAMKKVIMTTHSSDDPLSLTYPANVARDALGFLSSVSLESVIAHGPGMEIKIFEIVNTLLDVINCVPSLTNNGSARMTQGPRDIFHGLNRLLVSLVGGESNLVSLLQAKMVASPVSFQQIPRLLEIKDEFTTNPGPLEHISDSSPPSTPAQLLQPLGFAASNVFEDFEQQRQKLAEDVMKL